MPPRSQIALTWTSIALWCASCSRRSVRSAALRSAKSVRLFEKVFARYEAILANAGQIDFDDMLWTSEERLREQPVQGRLKAILIDEFQDMSNARAELIKAVLRQNPPATLSLSASRSVSAPELRRSRSSIHWVRKARDLQDSDLRAGGRLQLGARHLRVAAWRYEPTALARCWCLSCD